MIKIKVCICCNKKFETSKYNPHQIYCSESCLTKVRYHKRKDDPEYKRKARKSQLAWRAKYPEKYKTIMDRNNQKQTEKARNDPAYREYLYNLNKKWLEKNPDKKIEYLEKDNTAKKKKYEENPVWKEKQKVRTKIYHSENPEINQKSYKKLRGDPIKWAKRVARDKVYYVENREKIYARQRATELASGDKYEKLRQKWRKENPEKVKSAIRRYTKSPHGRTKMNAYRRKKIKEDPQFRMSLNIRHRLYEFIKDGKGRKYGKTKELLGCDWDYFYLYMEKRFTAGMNWENYGEWHVDHIIPISSFDLLNEEDQRICQHHTNLQPLWAEDNLKKGNNII